MSTRQTRRPVSSGKQVSGAGVAVDSYGGPAVDPTENVLSLVDAESKYQNDMREAETRRTDDLRTTDNKHYESLAAQREKTEVRIERIVMDFGKQIADILSAQTDKSAILLSTTVDKLSTATNDRLAVVEKNQYVSGGRTSVSDPATADALREMAQLIRSQQGTQDKTTGQGIGQREMFAWLIAVGTLLFMFLKH